MRINQIKVSLPEAFAGTTPQTQPKIAAPGVVPFAPSQKRTASEGLQKRVSPALASLLGASIGAKSLTGADDAVAVAVADKISDGLKKLAKSGGLAKMLAELSPKQMFDVQLEYYARELRPLRDDLANKLSGDVRREALAAFDAKTCRNEAGHFCGKTKLKQLMQKGCVRESELVTHYGYTSNNKIELYVRGKNAFPEVFKAIDDAKDHVHVCYYIFNNDPLGQEFKNKLIAAAKRGCEVRVSIDGIGSSLLIPGSTNKDLIKELEAGGVIVQKNHMIDLKREQQRLNHPDHRKIVVVDGKVGFTGGMNVATHYLDEYHDLMMRIEGDAVKQMQSEFLQHWVHLGSSFNADANALDRYFPDHRVAPGTTKCKISQAIPGEHREIMDKSYLARIAAAEKCIYIENPYCTNPDIQTALIAAAKRGVEIHVILPGESDHGFSHLAARQRYPEMIRAGVKIYEYPGFNHGKVMMVDDKFVTFGSSNLDDVALYHIYEMNIDTEDEAWAAQIKRDIFDKDIPNSKLMNADDVTLWQRLSGRFFRLFAHFI